MSFVNGDVVRCAVRLRMSTFGLALNIFEAKLTLVSVPPYSDVAAKQDWKAYIESIFTPLVGDIYSLYVFEGFDLSKRSGTEWLYQTSGTLTLTPADGGLVLPSGDASVLTAYTDVGKVRGRKFIAGLTASKIASGLLNSTILAHLVLAATAWVSQFACITGGPFDHWTPGVWSKKVAGFVPFNLRALITNIPGYQRRRKLGVGV